MQNKAPRVPAENVKKLEGLLRKELASAAGRPEDTYSLLFIRRKRENVSKSKRL